MNIIIRITPINIIIGVISPMNALTLKHTPSLPDLERQTRLQRKCNKQQITTTIDLFDKHLTGSSGNDEHWVRCMHNDQIDSDLAFCWPPQHSIEATHQLRIIIYNSTRRHTFNCLRLGTVVALHLTTTTQAIEHKVQPA